MRVASAGFDGVDRYRAHCRWKRKLIISQDWDWWTIHDGSEGTGKSTEAMWNAYYTDENFLKHWRDVVVYDAESFIGAIETAKPATSIILDEAGEVWYFREWYDEVHRALDKMSQQIRDRNLDIHLCAPSLFYVGRLAIRRGKDWAHVEAPQFHRGFLELLEPHWSKFEVKKMPYWETRLYHRFNSWPAVFYDQYRIHKRAAAEARLSAYLEDIEPGKKGRLTIQEQVDEVVKSVAMRRDRDQFRGATGKFERSMLCAGFPISLEAARAASIILNRKFPSPRPPKAAKRQAP